MTPALVPTYNPVVHGPVDPCCPMQQPPPSASHPPTQQPPPVVPPNRPPSPPPAANATSSTEDPATRFQQMKQQLLLAERAKLVPTSSSDCSYVSHVPPNSPVEPLNIDEVEESREEVLAQQYEQRERSRVQTGGFSARGHATPPSSQSERDHGLSL